MKTKTINLFVLISLTFAIAACSSGTASNQANTTNAANTTAAKPAVNRADEEAALKETDLAWSAAASKLDVDATVAFMADDGTTMSPNVPASKGKEAVKKEWQGLLGLKDVTISWSPSSAQVAESGEVGYTSGTWQMTWTDAKQGKVGDKGKYLEVWKKVAGKWKCYLDMYSSDQAAPAPQK